MQLVSLHFEITDQHYLNFEGKKTTSNLIYFFLHKPLQERNRNEIVTSFSGNCYKIVMNKPFEEYKWKKHIENKDISKHSSRTANFYKSQVF